ncbi:MAG: hypothetical protein V1776_05175 [Candidatus Diapherotrites archaeon]
MSPSTSLKGREEVLQSLLKKIDSDIALFDRRAEKLRKKHDELTDAVMDAGLEPVPISFAASGENAKKTDVLQELENHIMELNKLKNLISMKLKRVLQEEELLDHLRTTYGKGVAFNRNTKGGIELQVKDLDADVALSEVMDSKKKIEALRIQIQELGGE